MAFTFRCDACELLLDDGVDYSYCPKCNGAVRSIIAESAPPSQMPSVAEMSRFTLYALIAVQSAAALIWPHDFPYLRPLLLAVQAGAVVTVFATLLLAPLVRALFRSKIRVLHGFEHATIAVLAERGTEVDNGLTRKGSFEIVLDGRNGYDLAVEDVRGAAESAISRVARGEHELVYSPRCGTSWLVARLVVAFGVAVVGAIALGYHLADGYAFAGTVVACAAAMRSSRALGLLAQRAFTVSPHFASARVTEIVRTDGAWVHFEVGVDVTLAPGKIAEPIG